MVTDEDVKRMAVSAYKNTEGYNLSKLVWTGGCSDD